MNDVPAHLIIKRGPNPEQAFSLAPEEVTIGRSSTNVIAIADPEVSRRHACIKWTDNSYIIEDWGSTNGTFVNDQRINGPVMLFNGDEIRLGDTIVLQFEANQEYIQNRAENLYWDNNEGVTMVDAQPQVWPSTEERQEIPPAPAEAMPPDQFIVPDQGTGRSRFWRWTAGCGCGFLLLIFLCMATVYFLDAYQQGRLLYCGPLRPFFEILLGPFGFAPVCT
jgi:hypothetical protein